MEDVLGSQREILEYALKFEQDGYDFYCSASEKVSNPLGKKMLQWLAREETEHKKKLKSAYEKMKAEGKWGESAPGTEERDTFRFKTLFSQAKEKVKAIVPADVDELKALEMAMEMENKGYKFYTHAQNEIEDPEGKALLESLARDESDHYDALQNTYIYLKTPDLWFAWEEGHIYEAGP
ncbi:MAG: ferritin family protein [bacterium]